MVFIKVESEDMKIEETFSVKQEETEEQTDLKALKEETEVLNKKEEKDQYTNHHDFITGEKPFSCSQPEKTSSRSRAQKARTKGNFICKQCGKSFNHKRNLYRHTRAHTREKLYTYPQCGTIIQDRNLIVHKRESSFTCQQCGNRFTQKGNLNRHMRNHSGEKPYMCFQCGKSFTQIGHFEDHTRIHTGEKPFTCKQCGKSFNQKGILTRHMRIHTGEKLFKCCRCEKTFKYKETLDYHEDSCMKELYKVISVE